MPTTAGQLSCRVVTSEPLGRQGGSENKIERVTLDDGAQLIRKRVSPESDWMSRATGDDGRALSMWTSGIFDRIPASIDHATVAVEPDDDGWVIFMRDVSDVLVPENEILDREAVRRILSALAELHNTFRRPPVPSGLCSLEDRYQLLSPRTARRELARGNSIGETMSRCWEAFAELVPGDMAAAILALAERPGLLAAQLERCELTLIHGNVRLSNLGAPEGPVVLIDWGERTGHAPAAVEIASFLVFDAERLDVSCDDVIADFRDLCRDHWDETALHLALIGGMVQLGPNPVLEWVLEGGDEARALAVRRLGWWIERASEALEVWSPV